MSLAVLFLGWSGCADPTQVEVEVSIGPDVLEAAGAGGTLRVGTWLITSESGPTSPEPETDDVYLLREQSLPVVINFYRVTEGARGFRVLLEVEGQESGTLISQQQYFAFVEDARSFETMALSDECLDVSCGADASCDQAVCVPHQNPFASQP